MKKLYFLFTFIFITKVAYSQQNKGFSFGLNFSPNYDNFLFTGESKDAFNYIKDYQKPHWGYTYGLTLKYMFNKRLGVETGTLLTKKGATIEAREAQQLFQYRNNFRYVENYFSAEIPLKISYKIINSAISCALNIGGSFSYTYRFKGEADLPDNAYNGPAGIIYMGGKHIGIPLGGTIRRYFYFKDMELIGYRNFNLIPSASLTVSYRLNDKLSIGLEPTFRYSLLTQDSKKYETITYTYNPISISSTYDTRQVFWNYGLNTSIYYHF